MKKFKLFIEAPCPHCGKSFTQRMSFPASDSPERKGRTVLVFYVVVCDPCLKESAYCYMLQPDNTLQLLHIST